MTALEQQPEPTWDPNPKCGHLLNANSLAAIAPCRPMPEGFVDAIAIALAEARRQGWDDAIKAIAYPQRGQSELREHIRRAETLADWLAANRPERKEPK